MNEVELKKEHAGYHSRSFKSRKKKVKKSKSRKDSRSSGLRFKGSGQKTSKTRPKQSVSHFGVEEFQSSKTSISPSKFTNSTWRRFQIFQERRDSNVMKMKLEKIQKQYESMGRKESSLTPGRRKDGSKSERRSLISRIDSIIDKKAKKIHEKRKENLAKKKFDEMNGCSYKPRINEKSRDSKRSVDDLIDWMKERNRKLVEKRLERKAEEFKTEKGFSSHRRMSSEPQSGMKVEERLLIQGKNKDARIKKMRRKKLEGLFQPKISSRSREIASNGNKLSTSPIKVNQIKALKKSFGLGKNTQRDHQNNNYETNYKKKGKKNMRSEISPRIEKVKKDQIEDLRFSFGVVNTKTKNGNENIQKLLTKNGEKKVQFRLQDGVDSTNQSPVPRKIGKNRESSRKSSSRKRKKNKKLIGTFKSSAQKPVRRRVSKTPSKSPNHRKSSFKKVLLEKRKYSTSKSQRRKEILKEDNVILGIKEKKKRKKRRKNVKKEPVSGYEEASIGIEIQQEDQVLNSDEESDIGSIISDSKIRKINKIFLGKVGIKDSHETKEKFKKDKVFSIMNLAKFKPINY